MSLIRLAIIQAFRSQCRYRVGAVLAEGNRVFAAAPNTRRNSPRVDYLHATFHAEEAALRKARRTSGTVAYVARVGADGTPMMARPCPRCQRVLRQAGVTKVFYTVDQERVETMKLDAA